MIKYKEYIFCVFLDSNTYVDVNIHSYIQWIRMNEPGLDGMIMEEDILIDPSNRRVMTMNQNAILLR